MRPLKARNTSARNSRLEFYRPELDAMRFFAFLLVFLHHTLSRPATNQVAEQITLRNTFATSAKFSVSLFFLLSGYLISTLLAMEKELTGKVHLWDFYKRRMARIWPLYYTFMVLVLLIGTAVHRILPSAGAVVASTFFSGNWFLIIAGANLVGGLGILWSVNVEEQFYLVWPLIAKQCERRSLIWVSTGVILAAYVILIVLGALGIVSDVALRFNPFVEMQFFAAGALLAIWLPRDGLKVPASIRILLGSTGILLWMAGTHFFGSTAPAPPPRWWMPAALYSCVLAGCLAIFLSFFGMPGRFIPKRILWLGKISYGLYVYHELVLTLMPRWPTAWEHRAIFAGARLCLELSIVILVAGLSYAWLEMPFLRWKERITFVRNRSV
ncbi:acyltransferase [Granulicella sp. L46]|uniref:acyltransferase family protein n=1 Tax=Granulicella sp. L46 TaxID=1641865 RepID=UPI002110DABC|nr:acyltransferase [Granulicella sp. L46]